MALDANKAIRVELRDLGTQHGGRWKLRCNFYFYNCITCSKEISFQKADLKRMSGRCRACADKDTGLKSSITNRIRPFEALYNKFYYDRQRAGQECDVSYEDFLEFVKIKDCHYCGEAVQWAECSLGKNGARYNLDRKDNRLWYLNSNLVVCCWDCNETKSDKFTYEEFLEIGAVIRAIKKERLNALSKETQ